MIKSRENTKGGFILPLIILVVAAVVIGGGVYTYSKQNLKITPDNQNVSNDTSSSTTTTDSTVIAPVDGGATASTSVSVGTEGTLKDLFAIKTPQVCTITLTGGDFSGGAGKVYISGGNMRSDYTTTISGKTYGTHIVVKGDVSYTWIDGMNTGFKTAVNKTAPPVKADVKAVAKTQAPDMDQKVKYTCATWTPDATKFDLPSVQFTDMSTVNVKPPTMPVAE